MADWETVRTIALRLPGAEESTTYGQPAFKVGGKLFAWISPDRRADGALALRIDLDEKPLAIEWADVVAMRKAADESGGKVCVCFECRYSF